MIDKVDKEGNSVNLIDSGSRNSLTQNYVKHKTKFVPSFHFIRFFSDFPKYYMGKFTIKIFIKRGPYHFSRLKSKK